MIKTGFRRWVLAATIPLLSVSFLADALAQADFPSRPLRIVVANTPGSTVDLVARKLGEGLGVALGQPVVIVNQPGAGGLVGSQTIAQAPRDGYTLGFYGNTAVIVPHLHKAPGFDPVRDITAVAIVGNIPFVAVVARDSPIRDVRGLVEQARRAAGKLTLGSAGAGTAIHLAGMHFQSMAGIELLHVPYKGVAPLQLASASGEIDVAFPTVGSVAALIQQGRLRALGVTGAQRAALLPDTPTIAEAGVAGYAFESWLALAAPAGVPPAIMRRLADEVRALVAREDMQQLFAKNAITPGVVAGAAVQQMMADDYERMGKLVRNSGATAQ